MYYIKMIVSTSLILLSIILKGVVSNNRNVLKKKINHKVPFPKKLVQHSPYYTFKHATQYKKSYQDSYDYLYGKNKFY